MSAFFVLTAGAVSLVCGLAPLPAQANSPNPQVRGAAQHRPASNSAFHGRGIGPASTRADGYGQLGGSGYLPRLVFRAVPVIGTTQRHLPATRYTGRPSQPLGLAGTYTPAGSVAAVAATQRWDWTRVESIASLAPTRLTQPCPDNREYLPEFDSCAPPWPRMVR